MNFNIIDQAVKLIRNKFKINFIIKDYTVQMNQEDFMIGTQIRYRREPELKLTITVVEDHTSWTEYIDLDYIIFGSDLYDGSKVDEVIGGNISGYDVDMRQALRLAFIIYNGIKYGVKREQRIDYIEKGWHPRVVRVSTRF